MANMLEKILLAAGAGGAALFGGCVSAPKASSFLDMLNVPAKSASEEPGVNDPKHSASTFLEEYKKWYDSDIADGSIKIDGDVASKHALDKNLADFLRRANDYLADKKIAADEEAKGIVGQVKKSAEALKSHVEGNVWESGLVRITVDAEQKSNGRHMNFGNTDKNGGYMLEASLEDVQYAIAASLLTPEPEKNKSYSSAINAKFSALKNDKDYRENENSKKALKEAKAIVDEMKAEAGTRVELAGTDSSSKSEYSARLSYRQALAVVSVLGGDDWMRESMASLSPASSGVFKAVPEGIAISYVVDFVPISKDDVGKYHPDNYKAKVMLVGKPAAK